MTVQVSKWGNSLGVRLPKVISDRIGLKKGSEVSIFEESGRIVIEKASYTLEGLLSLKKECPYKELSTGPARGNEEW